jgi:putative ABC transport system substrate-binding protein
MELTGGHAARALKGEKPADLPVLRRPSSKWCSTAGRRRRLGIDISPTLLATADDVIE